MSCLGNFIPPFGHSVTALRSASSSVGAQDRCSCRILTWPLVSRSASFAPASNRPSSDVIFSAGAPGVMMPSARRPAFFAVSGPAVAM